MQADLYDAQITQIKATIGAAGGKPPKIDSYPRPNPKAETPEEKKPTTVAEIFHKFNTGKH